MNECMNERSSKEICVVLGSQESDDNLSSRVRRFYKRQDNLIDSFQKLHEDTTDTSKRKSETLDKQKQYTEWMIRATLVFNVVSISKLVIISFVFRIINSHYYLQK